MTGYLVDTNVLSEIRKGDRRHPGVAEWFARTPERELFLSVLTLGEVRRGVLAIRERDPSQAVVLSGWLHSLQTSYAQRLLPVGPDVADRWAELMMPRPRPVVDALLGATALVHDLTLVTRNTADLEGSGVPVLNPFEQ